MEIIGIVATITTVITFGKLIVMESLSTYIEIHERLRSARGLRVTTHKATREESK